MILVDTSVWVDHLRRGNASLATLLESGEVLCHPFVIGELACGNLRNRREVLSLLAALPQANEASTQEAMALLERSRLRGRGLGWIDVHLLTSTVIDGVAIWTLDRPLAAAAGILGVVATPA